MLRTLNYFIYICIISFSLAFMLAADKRFIYMPYLTAIGIGTVSSIFILLNGNEKSYLSWMLKAISIIVLTYIIFLYFEYIYPGTISDLLSWWKSSPVGNHTLLVGPKYYKKIINKEYSTVGHYSFMFFLSTSSTIIVSFIENHFYHNLPLYSQNE